MAFLCHVVPAAMYVKRNLPLPRYSIVCPCLAKDIEGGIGLETSGNWAAD